MAAVPNDSLTINFPCQQGGGAIFPLSSSCGITFKNNPHTDIVSASTPFIAALAGVHYLPLSLGGPSADDYDAPRQLTIFVNSGLGSYYYTKFTSPLVYSSCCGLPPVLKCGKNPKYGVQFISSCEWKMVEGSSTWQTHGIVFSNYNNLQLPVSVDGLRLTYGPSSVELGVPSSSRISACGDCKRKLTDLRSTDTSEGMCYSYKPDSGDLREFVSQQSLSHTFLTGITRSNLLPTWISLTVTDDPEAVRRQVEADYRVSIASETQLLQLSGCEAVILDTKGHFSVLLHNGPLDIGLQTPSLENISLPIPIQGSFYCIAVEMCSGSRSPVYMGVPFNAQNSLTRLSFLSEFTSKGWQFTFLSFIFWSGSNIESTGYQYWNGLTHDYTPSALAANMKTNMEASGELLYLTTTVRFIFKGNVSYKYSTKSSEVSNCKFTSFNY